MSTATRALFVGGPMDGERRVLEDYALEFVSMILEQPGVIRPVLYKRANLPAETVAAAGLDAVMVPRDMEFDAFLAAVIAGYRLPKGENST